MTFSYIMAMTLNIVFTALIEVVFFGGFFWLVATLFGASPNERVADFLHKILPLPKAIVKRTVIVAEFNEKQGLHLTKEQIENIVNASYISQEWKDEIKAMKKKYRIPEMWLCSSTGWLRIYLKAFSVQEISSDFAKQKEIVKDSFGQIFMDMDKGEYNSRHDEMDAINKRFFTTFNDFTLQNAEKFLIEEGYFEQKRENEGGSVQCGLYGF